jgi:hypothetical protein
LSVPCIKLIKTKKILTLSLVVFLSSILIIGTGLTAYAQVQQTQVFIVGSDNEIHEANLKATKDGDGQLQKISTFKIEAPNVVQINQGKDLVVFTNPPQDQVQKVKIRNTQGQLTELERLTGLANTYSLAGYPVGVYVLDVIVQLSNNRQGAYETILVIIPANQQPQPINFPLILQIIQTIIDTDIRVITDDDDNGDDDEICDNGEDDDGDGLVDSEDPDCPPDGCPEGQERVDGQCVPICEEGQERVDGQCVPTPCPDGREPVDGVCPEPPEPCPEGTTGTPPDCKPIPCDPEVDPECLPPPPPPSPFLPPPCDPEVDPECLPPPPGPCEGENCPCPEGEDCPTPPPPPPPPPPLPCEGEDCPTPPGPPGPGLLPGPGPEPEPIEEEESEIPEDNGESGGGSEDDGGDNGDNGGGDGGDGVDGGGGGESGAGAAE